MSKIHVRPEHLRQTGGKVSGFGGKLAEGGQKLESAGQSLVSHASGDRSGIGAVVAKLFGRGVQITGKVFSEGGRVVDGAGKRLHTTADLYEEADSKGAERLKKLHPDTNGRVDPPGGAARAGTRVGAGGGRKARTARRHVGGSARSHAVPPTGRTTTKDPVDLATGEVLLTQTDLTLAGVLPLVLARTHVSSYRVGQLFGRSWASTLDQRLEMDEAGVVFVADDGTLLVYPTPPDDGAAVLAEEGPRKTLHRNDTGYEVNDGQAGRRLRFDDSGVLIGIEDLAGHSITVDRGSDGSPTAVRHSGGYRVGIAVVEGLLTELRVGETTVMRFGYEDRDLVTVTNESGTPLRFTYDHEGRLTEWFDRNGMWYRYHYDSLGRCTLAKGAGGQLNSTIEYDRENLVTTMTDSLGHVTTYHLNAANQVVRTVDPLGGETTSDWDRYDRLLSRTDPLGRITRFEYSEAGDLTRITRADGTQAVAEFNDLHLPTTVIAPDGATWRRDYDEVGNLVSVADPAGAVTRVSYDEDHHLASTTDAHGAVTRFICDAAGLPVSITDPFDAITRYDRDEFGRVVAVTDPVGGVTRLRWIADGRLAEQIQTDGSRQSWRYDGEGNVTEHVDAAGQVTRIEYGGFDLPVAETDPTGARTVYGYDTELRLVSVTNPAGLSWTYDYDPAGNLTRETDFNGRTLSYDRDIAGQLVGTTNGLGRRTTRSLDLIGRVIEQRSTDGVTTFSYDPVGRLARATTANTDLVFTRDQLGRVLAETCNGRTLTSTYDLVGRKTSRTTPAGIQSQWRYDLAGRLAALEGTGRTLTFGYDAAGREISRSMGTATLTQTWDSNHRLHTQALTAPGLVNPRLLQRRGYTYRRDGAVSAIVDQLAGPQQFDLDPLGRATGVVGSDRREQYSYDASGNLAAPTRSYTGTLLRTSDTARFDYDAQGRVIARHSRTLSGQARTWRYTWNDDDRLIEVTTPDQVTWRYVYDALGRRTAKLRMEADGRVAEQTWFVWDGTTLAEQIDAAGRSTSWDYRPGSHVPLAQTEQSEIDQQFYAIVTDLVGTPSELVNADGAVAWRRNTTLWGARVGEQRQAAHCPLGFPGQYHDAETGQHYNYFRYYDPENGVYTSADPLGLAGGANPHAYVPNPVSWSDPLGLAPYSAGSRSRFTVSPGGEITDHIGNHNSVSLGRYPAYIEHAQATGSRTFNIGDAWNDMEGRKDKFGGSGDNSEIWIRNRQFLDQAIARHSDMFLASNPDAPANEGSYFMREINYLKSKGYTVSADGSRMVPPGGH